MKIDKELSEIVKEISGTEPSNCMKCGKCSGRCPAYDEMDYPPHEFVMMVEKGRIEELLESKTLWNCLSCMACIERCPRNVAPGALIEAVRKLAVSKPGTNHFTPEDVADVLDEELPQQALMSAFRKYRK